MGLSIVNPYSGEVLREIPYDTQATLDQKLDRARTAQKSWRALPLERRIREVKAAVEYFRKNADEIARDVTLQMGKPIKEARGEVKTLLARSEYMLSIAPSALATDVLPSKPGFQLRIEHAPLGVVLDIAAWNYPLIVPVNVVVPALIAGNAVLVKHSPLTPLCGASFERAFESLSVPGLVANVVVTNEDAERLIGDARIDYVSFTGSVASGRKVYAAAAKRLIDVGLELGGKDPAYVAEDADLEFACENVIEGACYNAGQSCCAVERVYVHAKRYDEFVERAKSVLAAYKLGDPLDETTTLGPLARKEALDVLEAQVADALKRGARLLAGGKRATVTSSASVSSTSSSIAKPASARSSTRPHDLFFEPTLLVDCPNDALVMQEESFGPLVPVARVKDDDEAIAKMNDSRYGLTASVWTKDAARAERFARELEAGTVFQNRCDYLDPSLAWTGVKESGIGATLSRYGFQHLTRRKSIHFRA
jgi:acyl-CoA reductase-like NAD-dependent aldehyde dehydrogenase